MTAVAASLSVEQWAMRLNEVFRKVVDSAKRGFVELGNELLAAQAQLTSLEWRELLTHCKFDASTARVFIRIAEWAKNASNARVLDESFPADYTTIDKLIRLDKPVLDSLVGDGTVCPKTKRNEVSKVLRLQKVAEDEQRILSIQPRPGKYRTILVDPAWEFDAFSKGAMSRAPYAKQTIDELTKLALRDWAEQECHLYCCCPNAYLEVALNLIKLWGFTYKNLLVWIKDGAFGYGRYFRNSTELILFATLGDRTTRADNIATHFCAPRGEHSEKPEELYDIIRAASYPPYGEGNQRKFRDDFTDLFMAGDALIEAAE